MDTISYLKDPEDEAKVSCVVTDHARFTVETGKVAHEAVAGELAEWRHRYSANDCLLAAASNLAVHDLAQFFEAIAMISCR